MQERRTKDLEKELSACAELHKFLEDNQEYMVERPLSELLLMYLDKKEMTRAEVIEGSGLNDIYTHQIFAGKRKPSRDKLLCLCFGLKFTAEETQLLLKETGYVPLYVKKRRDSIILYAFIKELTLIECNDLLYEEKERLQTAPQAVQIKKSDIQKFLWMEQSLELDDIERLYEKYQIIFQLKQCISEFREIFYRKNMLLLYMFIANYKTSINVFK